MVDTIKFSDFADGGDLANNEITVGLGSGVNTRYNNPWTFLKPGSTGDRPTPAASMYYRLRFNTTLEIYEYYDPTIPIWVELSGSGTGTVNPGVANDIAFYAASGQAVSPIAGAANSVLVTNSSEVPSLSTTFPSGLTLPGATITSSTAALLSGSVVAAPVSGPDLVNKTYADGLFAAGVSTATGTTNQVLINGVAGVPTNGAIILSLPQDIALGSTPTFAGLTLSSIPLGPSSGGTGVNNGLYTLTLGGPLATLGTFSSNFTMTGTTNITFPTTGILATTSQIPTGAALTKTDDTNVTLTLAGSPTTALVNAASLTLGWTGLLSVARGGTGVGSVTTSPTATSFAGWDANSNLSANSLIGGFLSTVSSVSPIVLTVASAEIQEITGSTAQTFTMPVVSTLKAGQSYTIINNSSATATVNSSGSNLILSMAANTTAFFTCVLITGTSAASWNSSYIFDNGAGVLSITGTTSQVIASASTGAVTLSLPQSIATSSSPTFAGLTTTGIHTASGQPAFNVFTTGNISNVTGDGTNYTVIFPATNVNVGSNYNTTTGLFTAPVTGTYIFTGSILLGGLVGGTNTNTQAIFKQAGSATQISYLNYQQIIYVGETFFMASGAFTCFMTAADTMSLQVQSSGGTKIVSVVNNPSIFGGYLIG